MDKCTPRWTF